MRRPQITSISVFLKIWLCITTGLLSVNIHATEFSPQALIEKSGVGVQLDFLPRSLKIAMGHAMKNGTLRLSTEQIRDIHAAFDHAYAPVKLRKMMSERITERITSEEGERIIAFLESPLGKRIIERESRLAQPEIQTEIQENASKLVAEAGANVTRLALYSSLNQAMGEPQRTVQIYIGSALATNAAILSVMPDTSNRPSLEEIKKGLESQMLAITSAMSQVILSNTAYAYQDLSEEELNAYLQFALSPEGKVYSFGFGGIIAEVLVECAFEAGVISAPQRSAPI